MMKDKELDRELVRELVYNAIKTPDGTILESEYRQDYKEYKDKNGETYINDGGMVYLRRSVNKEPYEDLALYTTDSIEMIREVCAWGTYGINPNGLSNLRYVKIKNLSNAHLEAILEDCGEDVYKGIIKRELSYRIANDIFVGDN